MKAVLNLIRLQWRHHKLAFMAGLFAALIPALAGLALLGVAGWFITAAALAGFSGALLNVFVPSASIRALALLRTLGRYGERLITHDTTFRFLTDLRVWIFRGQARHAGSGRKMRSGIALNRLTADIKALDAVYLRLVVPFVLTFVGGLAVLIWVASFSFLLILGPLILIGFTVCQAALALSRHRRREARRQEAALDAVRLRTVDLVAGRRDLAVYGGLDQASQSILSADERLGGLEDEVGLRHNVLSVWSSAVGQWALALTLCLCAVLVGMEVLAPPLALAIILVAMGLPEVVTSLVPGLSGLGRISLAASRAASAVGPADQDSGISGRDAGNDEAFPVLCFENVEFGYPMAGRKVLSGLSFDIRPGEWVALAGRSGSGKSTVSALASGLLSPQQGQITLSGQELRSHDEAALRSLVTVIGQRPYLFHDTVAENLRIACPNASEEDLWQALEAASLADRIRQSGDGLHTVLGEDGTGLSGGEQRRLGLARAYLTRPALFILDEFTEGLDRETALEVLDRFRRFKRDAAVLMIAHKADEIAAADRVIHLEGRDDAMADAAVRRA